MTESVDDRLRSGLKGPDYLAHQSSRGPTMDGRMKPDLVAPGYTILTAKSKDEAMVEQVYGTSFSVGVVSGSAAIVRQYFEDGHHDGIPISPSGSLVKAILMNGGQEIDKVQNQFTNAMLETTTAYDHHQGMGRINLLSSLPLSDDPRKLRIFDNEELKARSRRRMFIKAKTSRCESSELSVTLAWYDIEGAHGCTKCLMNDLDLWVERINPAGEIISGQKYMPNGLGKGQRDAKNNVERVRFDMTNGHRYQIIVKSQNFATETQRFSLVATGCFINTKKPAKKAKST